MCNREDCGCNSLEKKCNCLNGGGCCSEDIIPLISEEKKEGK